MMRRVDLAQQVLLTPSGITRLLDGLQRCGYVEKAACASDARVVYAKLTDEGLAKLQTATDDHVAASASCSAPASARRSSARCATFLERLDPEASD